MKGLEVAGLSAAYGRARVLHDLTFSIGAGEAVALLGRNGMGKTSTARAIVGLSSPIRTKGTVHLGGRNLTATPPHVRSRVGLGYVPQGRRIFKSLTVHENLTVARQRNREGAEWNADRVYAAFPQLARRIGSQAGRLSGGEQQMLAVGRALMTNPSILILDEPSEGLAPAVVRDLVEALAELKESGLSILLAEQNLSLAERITDRFLVIDQGEIAADLTKGEFMRDVALQHRLLALGEVASSPVDLNRDGA